MEDHDQGPAHRGSRVNILLTGAGGLIARALADKLLCEGHCLTCVVRPGAARQVGGAHPERLRLVELDFASAGDPSVWLPLLTNIQLVINTVGIFREHGDQTFARIHLRAPVALFEACLRAGVKRVIQLSALGADEAAKTAFLISKKTADDHLLGLPLNSVVVQPSLVYATHGPSAALFNRMAILPLWLLPEGDGPWLQPVHREDVVQGLLALVDGPLSRQGGRIVFAGPQAVTLLQYLQALRRQLGGTDAAWLVRLPRKLFLVLAALAGKFPGSLVTGESVQMLLHGNTGDASAFRALLGRAPRQVSAFVASEEAAAVRRSALLACLLPLARVSVALVWLWTALVSFGIYPVQDSLALLARTGVTGALALWLLYGAAALDLALGLATLALSARWRRPLWAGQLMLIAAYTVVITIFLPEYWLHPYGPVLKNIPMAVLIGMLYTLEPSCHLRGKPWTT
jgi:uncharacterized protein YbjT (DUF2867 family)